jgi:hypothetical protein
MKEYAGSGGIVPSFLPSVLGGIDQLHAPVALPPGKELVAPIV